MASSPIAPAQSTHRSCRGSSSATRGGNGLRSFCAHWRRSMPFIDASLDRLAMRAVVRRERRCGPPRVSTNLHMVGERGDIPGRLRWRRPVSAKALAATSRRNLARDAGSLAHGLLHPCGAAEGVEGRRIRPRLSASERPPHRSRIQSPVIDSAGVAGQHLGPPVSR